MHDRNEGLAEAVLRISADHHDPAGELFEALQELYQSYGDGIFSVSVTANAILTKDGRYSIWNGQDFSLGSDGALYTMSNAVDVRDPGDASAVRTDYEVQDFRRIFFRVRENTRVTVHSLVNLIFIMRRYMTDFVGQTRYGEEGETLF
jgi:hypothetical protein